MRTPKGWRGNLACPSDHRGVGILPLGEGSGALPLIGPGRTYGRPRDPIPPAPGTPDTPPRPRQTPHQRLARRSRPPPGHRPCRLGRTRHRPPSPGPRFDAVRVPAARVHAAVHSDDPPTVAAFLRDWLAGPVLRDTRSASGPYYVLIAPNSPWHRPEERLTTHTFLGVPRLGHPVSTLTRWVVQPTGPGDLCDPAHLGALLLTADALRAVEP